MIRIPQLPHWCITDKFPAFYDTESVTAIEQTAKLYATMQKLIEDYNKFVTEVNTTIETFINDSNADQEEFENKINKIIHDYIITIDTKIAHQDRAIEETIVYIKENLKTAIEELIKQMHETGEFDEAVLNAIGGIEERVKTLETTTTEHTNTILTTNERILLLEKNHLTTEYDMENKKVSIYITNEGSEE